MTAPNEKSIAENKNISVVYGNLSTFVEEVAEELSALIQGEIPSPSLLSLYSVESLIKRVPIKTLLDEKDKIVGIYVYDEGFYREGENTLRTIYHYLLSSIKLLGRIRTYSSYENDFITQLSRATATREKPSTHLVLYHNHLFDWKKFIYQDELYFTLPDPSYFVLHKIPWPLDMDVLMRNHGRSYEEVKESFYEETVASRIFEQWVNNKWPLLLEIIGYCLLSGEYPLNKAVMLVDIEGREGRNGKSTFLSLLEALLSETNVSHIPLQDLMNGRFMRSQLYGKMANIFADLPAEAPRETGYFKTLTGEDVITADRKHRDPITFKNYAKLIFSTNKLPEVQDLTDAFWRRWIVVEFPNRFEDNPGFSRMLRDELLPREAGKILSYALIAVKHVMTEGKFSFQEEEGSYREKWLRKANSVYAFIKIGEEQGFLEFGVDKREESKSLYNAYQRWCDEEDREIVSPRRFTEELERLGYPKRKIGGERYYIGLSLKKEGISL